VSELLQPQLFNPGPREPWWNQHRLDSGVLPGGELHALGAKRIEERGSPQPASTPYRSAHSNRDADWVKNPLPQTEGGTFDHRSITRENEEFVPTWKVTTEQDMVNRRAVEHQLVNADPLGLDEDPIFEPYVNRDGGESYEIMDGNHRTVAAQRRGQLLIPGRVMRPLSY